ncbi:MAG: hypothetical protein WBD99_09410 [Thermodesulfobacteriota bacterium]
MNNHNKFLFINILLSLIFVSPMIGYGQSLEKRVSKLEAKISAQQKQLEEAYKTISKLQEELNSLNADLGTFRNLKGYVRLVPGTMQGVRGPNLIFEGVNVHIRNKRSSTTMVDGLGNLIIGYNEIGDEAGLFYPPPVRSGSHNLIVGSGHAYSSAGGFVAGYRNTIRNSFSTVTGGFLNVADGEYSSVSGGLLNIAGGEFSAVSGGMQNDTASFASSVAGGSYNESELMISTSSETPDNALGGNSNNTGPEIELTFENDGTKNETSVNNDSTENETRANTGKDVITVLDGSRSQPNLTDNEDKGAGD